MMSPLLIGSLSMYCCLCSNLVENIYTQEVYAEYKRRCDSVRGKPWGYARIPKHFLRGIVRQSADQSMLLAPAVLSRKLNASFCHASSASLCAAC